MLQLYLDEMNDQEMCMKQLYFAHRSVQLCMVVMWLLHILLSMTGHGGFVCSTMATSQAS